MPLYFPCFRRFTTKSRITGVSIQFLGDHTDVFQSLQKWYYPCPIATKISPVIDYELKFVKMQFLVKSISPWKQLTKKLKPIKWILWHILNAKHWQHSHWNVLAMDVCMMGINLEKLAYRQNSECCNADFWPVRRLGLSWNFKVL